MLGDHLKALRQAKGLSQEELAIRLHVVRQTVSKWERNLSVPDAQMLLKIAEVLEVPVEKLLDVQPAEGIPPDSLAEQLSRINEQLAVRNRRTRLIVRVIIGILIGFAVLMLIWGILGSVSYLEYGKPQQQVIPLSESDIIYE